MTEFDGPMTATELQQRHDAYWAEIAKRPPPQWIQKLTNTTYDTLVNRTYEILKSNVSSSDDTPRDTLGTTGVDYMKVENL